MDRENEIMTLDQVADYLHVHPSTVYRLLKRRSLPAFKVGSDWRFRLEAIRKWAQAGELERVGVRNGRAEA